MPETIYLDHAATTPVRPEVLEAMLPYFSEHYGNPSSLHRLGRETGKALRKAHEQIAGVLGCLPGEIVITASGTEADNLALRGVAFARRQRGQGNHLIVSAVEHKGVLETAHQLRDLFGFELTELPVDAAGRVSPAGLAAAIRPDTLIVSIMAANNEVGTVQPLADLAAVCRERGVPLHSDAVQASGTLSLKVDELGVDLLSLGAHKFYGPKGIGLLYVRRGVPVLPQVTGGSQEGTRRAGTENVPFVVGLARGAGAVTGGAGCRGQSPDGAARPADRRRAGGGAGVHLDRPSHRAAGQPRQLYRARHRSRGHADRAGHGRHLRQQRFGLHQRRAGAQPRADRHGHPAPGGRRPPAFEPGAQQRGGGCRATAGGFAPLGGTLARVVPVCGS